MSGLDSVFPILVGWFDFSSKFNLWSAEVWSLSHLWFPVSVKSRVWFNDYKRFQVLLLLLLDESNSHVDVPSWMRTNNSFQIFSAKKRCASPMTCFSRSGPQVGVTKGKFSRWNVILTLTLHNTSSIYAMLSQQKKKQAHVSCHFEFQPLQQNGQFTNPTPTLRGQNMSKSPTWEEHWVGIDFDDLRCSCSEKKHRSTNSSIFLCELHSKFHQSSDSSISFSKNLNSVIMLSITLHSSTRWCSSRSLEVIALIVTDSGAT